MKPNASHESSPETVGSTITSAELLCLKLMASGQTPREIGDVLGMDVSIIEKHLRLAQEKLGAPNGMYAVLIALRQNLLLGSTDIDQ